MAIRIKEVIERCFPEGTIRRKIVRAIARIIKGLKISNIKGFFKSLKDNGVRKTFGKIRMILLSNYKLQEKYEDPYLVWRQKNEPNEIELNKQRKHKFRKMPKISLVVPMYKTPVNFFEELVDCLIAQTYSNWELCLADGSPEKHEEIEKIASKDERIKYVFLNENKNISGNTNEALKLVTGDYIGLLDHDDVLPPFSLYEIVKTINKNPDVEFIYTDEDKIDGSIDKRYDPSFKPDFAIDTLRAANYICHFSVFKKELMDKLGGFRSKYDGAQDYDIILRMSEETNKIIHIPKILYHWRVHKESTAMQGDAKPWAFEAGVLAIQDHIDRVGIKGKVEHGKTLGSYKINNEIKGNPKVSIMIPNKDGIDILKVCVESILEKTTYSNYEINIIENNSDKQETFDYYKEIEKNQKVNILYYPEKGFNYAKIMNFGAKNSNGDYLIQLNNDTELLSPNWLEEMIGYCQREDVGAVGGTLYYPDDSYQHAGVIVGIGGVAGHRFKGVPRSEHGYFAKESKVENLSAVTAACIMTKKSIYEEVGYMNEKLAVAFNDIDFCLKIRKNGKLIVYNPYIEFYHYESKSRGYEDSPEKIKRFQGEIKEFMKHWKKELKKGDPYYSKNLSLKTEQYEILTEKVD